MGNHHDHHSDEKKPVAFNVPLILGAVTIFIILLFVSLGDPKPGCHGGEHCEKEGKECCEKDAGKSEHGSEAHHDDAHAAEPASHGEEHH